MSARASLPMFLALTLGGCSCGDAVPLGPDVGGTGDGAAPGADTGPPADASGTPTDAGGPGARLRLRVEPGRVTLTTDGVTPARQSFRAFAARTDGTEVEVTTVTRFALRDPGLGTLTGAEFSGTHAGSSALDATLDGTPTLTATAAIEVRGERVVTLPGVPTGAPGLFDRAPVAAGRAPVLVYPNDGVLLPPNLGGVEIHFRKGDRDNSLFELTFTSPRLRLVIYTRCQDLAGGCLYTPDADVWRLLAASHAGREAVSLSVRGTDDRGTGVGRSATFRLSFAARAVEGGLYYWTTSNGTGIMRVDFGAQTPPERFFPFEGGGCWGCHALSRNGRKLTLSRDGQNQGQIRGVDIARRAIVFGQDDQEREQFQSWNPTSDRFVGIYGDREEGRDQLRIRDGDDGRVLERVELGSEPTHPDWSPRGDRIAYTRVTRHGTSQRPGRGGLSYVERVGQAWSAPRELIAPQDGFNRFYPAYAPDASFLVFDESRCNPGRTYGDECDADADEDARLFAILADGGRPLELARANAPGVGDGSTTRLSNTFPKWAPFVDPRRADGTGRVMWMTFSSRRHYGLRTPDGSNQQLWMVAVDPDAIARGEDGSFPAFALPFQDLTTSNHIAQWTTRIVPPVNTDGGVSEDASAQCLEQGEVCEPNGAACCGLARCSAQGGGVFVCRNSV